MTDRYFYLLLAAIPWLGYIALKLLDYLVSEREFWNVHFSSILGCRSAASEEMLIKMRLDRELAEYKDNRAGTNAEAEGGENMEQRQESIDALVNKIIELLKENALTYGEAVVVLTKANMELQKCQII